MNISCLQILNLILMHRLKIDQLYRDRAIWSQMCLINIAQSGYFSSDRTIEEYVSDIWKLDRVKR